MIIQAKGPTTGKINRFARFFQRMLAATYLSVAAGRGAYASPLLKPSLLPLDRSAAIFTADALPDGTVIVEVALSSNNAVDLARFSNLARSPRLLTTDSAGNTGRNMQGADWGPIPLTDPESYAPFSVMVSSSLLEAIFPAGMKLGESPIYGMAVDVSSKPRRPDSEILILTGLALVLAAGARRYPSRNLRRLNALESFILSTPLQKFANRRIPIAALLAPAEPRP